MKKEFLLLTVIFAITACDEKKSSESKNPIPQTSCIGSLNELKSAKAVALKAYQLQKQCRLSQERILDLIGQYDSK